MVTAARVIAPPRVRGSVTIWLLRPQQPILAFTPDPNVVAFCSLLWGVQPILSDQVDHILDVQLTGDGHGRAGDRTAAGARLRDHLADALPA
jgi:pyruvate kinase